MKFLELIVNDQVKLVAVPPEGIYLEEDKGLYEKTVKFKVFRVTDRSKISIGRFSFSGLPGNCGIVVSHDTFLTEITRGSGLSDPFRQLKSQIARELGYTMMMATTVMSNMPAVGNMMKSGYNIHTTFVNGRTGNLCGVGVKKLQ